MDHSDDDRFHSLEPEPIDVEPDPDDGEVEIHEPLPSEPREDWPAGDEWPPAPLMRVLPPDVSRGLTLLLQFVPDVELKRRADAAARQALGVDVTTERGLRDGERAVNAVKDALKTIDEDFKRPCAMANTLHKRLTGLRAEFGDQGNSAIKVVGRRLYVEQRRREQLDLARQREAQAHADEAAREVARRATEAARAKQAPKEIVEALAHQAAIAVAPPVSAPAVATLTQSTAVAKYRARLVGTPDDQEPHPKIEDLSLTQQGQVRRLLRAIADGEPLVIIGSINWAYLDRRAGAEPRSLAIPEIEVFDDGNVRRKRSI